MPKRATATKGKTPARATASKPPKKKTEPKKPVAKKAEKIAGQRRTTRTARKRKTPITVESSDEESEKSDSAPPAAKKLKKTGNEESTEDDLERDGLAILEDGDADKKSDDGEVEDTGDEAAIGSDEELQRAQERWRSPVYGFFTVTVDYKDGRRCHLFSCAARGCDAKVRRYLDTGDRASSGNLFKHARTCWTDEVVDHALELGSADVVREMVVKPKLRSATITEFFAQKNPKKLSISHRQLSRLETRVWAVRWVSEDLRPFAMFDDRGLLVLMKSGRPGYYVPSPSTVSRDVKAVFVATRKRLAKMLQEYPGRLSFASDGWTSPNHRSFVAITIHLELKGQPLRMLLDLVELAKSHTGVNLAVSFRDVLQEFGIEEKMLAITLDNASNNGKMVKHLGTIMPAFEGSFHHTRCFAHVIQLVARAFVGQFEVKELKEDEVEAIVDEDVRVLFELAQNIEEEERETRRARRLEQAEADPGADAGDEGDDDDDEDGDDEEWVDEVATLSDEEREEYEAKVRPIKMVLVKIRKLSFKIVNSSTKLLPAWRAVVNDLHLPDKLLPRDVRTRWNSTFDMLSISLDFRPAIDKMTDEDEGYGLSAFRVKKREWRVVEQLCDVLQVFKDATEYFSRDTPSLATVIPAMDFIDTKLTNQARDETLDEAIQTAVGISKKTLSRYYKLSDLSATYRIAMILHPRFKLQYFEEAGWRKGWIDNAREMVQEEFDFNYKREAGEDDINGAADLGLGKRDQPIPKGANMFDHLPHTRASNAGPVPDELDRYLATGTLAVDEPLKWWHNNEDKYPCLSRMARDYLSIPATTVVVERIFSKGRLCLSHIRNRLSAQTTRALLCVGEWSRLDLIRTEDLKAAAALPDLEDEEDESVVQEGWDRIRDALQVLAA